MEQKPSKFEYTYSAPTEQERREIESIRRQYVDSTDTVEGKMARLRKLDARVRNAACCVGLVLGIVGLLIFGVGLTAVLEWNRVILGVIVAAVGLVPILLAYPMYNVALRRQKKKYGEEILRLSEALLSQSQQ